MDRRCQRSRLWRACLAAAVCAGLQMGASPASAGEGGGDAAPAGSARTTRPLTDAALAGLRLAAGSDETGAGADSSSGSAPVYRKAWFLAGVAGVAILAAILLASGDEEDKQEVGDTGLPGFPPPPSLGRMTGSNP